MKKCNKSIWYRIWHWYIKGEYHCDQCPYSWEEKTSYEYDEWEAGCYIKGDICDTCRLLPPFRWVIGSLNLKKAEYYFNHQYDDFSEWAAKQEGKEEKFNELLNDFFRGYELCWKGENGEYHPINTALHIQHEAHRIRYGYEEYLRKQEEKENPYQNPWKKAILWSWDKFVNFFKPYFCK